jgi:DNA-binding PadR family transcriptional regulator
VRLAQAIPAGQILLPVFLVRPAITYNFDQSYKLNLMKIHKNIRKRYSRTEPPNDYLKYWRVIRRWVKSNYGLGTVELEMLLFLYSESYFTKDTFDEYNQLMSWNKKRFSDLLRDGWIHVFRKRKGKEKALYELSYKGRAMLNAVYNKLNGQEFAETQSANPMFKKSAPYTDVVYRNYIKKINQSIRQQQRPSQE